MEMFAIEKKNVLPRSNCLFSTNSSDDAGKPHTDTKRMKALVVPDTKFVEQSNERI